MITSIAEASASVGKAVLLLAIPAYLAVDAARLWLSDGYRDRREARQEALCFPLYDEEENIGDPLAEAARQAALPNSLVGKLDLFLQCATISEIGIAGVKLRQAQETRLTDLTAANRAGVEMMASETRVLLDEAYQAGLADGLARIGVQRSGGFMWQDLGGAGSVIQYGAGNSGAIGAPNAADGYNSGNGVMPPLVEPVIIVDPDADPPEIEAELPERIGTALDTAIADTLDAFDPATFLEPPTAGR